MLRPFSTTAEVYCRSYSLPLQRAITDFGADVQFGRIREKLREHHGKRSANQFSTGNYPKSCRVCASDATVAHRNSYQSRGRAMTRGNGWHPNSDC